MKSTMTDQELIDASAPAMGRARHGMLPEHFTPPMLQSMRDIADAAVRKAEDVLRDEFAIAALPAVVSKYAYANIAAEEAYKIADAMLEARNANR